MSKQSILTEICRKTDIWSDMFQQENETLKNSSTTFWTIKKLLSLKKHKRPTQTEKKKQRQHSLEF